VPVKRELLEDGSEAREPRRRTKRSFWTGAAGQVQQVESQSGSAGTPSPEKLAAPADSEGPGSAQTSPEKSAEEVEEESAGQSPEPAEPDQEQEEKDDDPNDEKEMRLMPTNLTPQGVRGWRCASFERRLAPELAMDCRATYPTMKKLEKMHSECMQAGEKSYCESMDKTRHKRTLGMGLSKGKIAGEKNDEVLYLKLNALIAIHPTLYYLLGVQAAFFRRRSGQLISEVKDQNSASRPGVMSGFKLYMPIMADLSEEESKALLPQGRKKFNPFTVLLADTDFSQAEQIVMATKELKTALEVLVKRGVPAEVALETFCWTVKEQELDKVLPRLRPCLALLGMLQCRASQFYLDEADALMTGRSVLSVAVKDTAQWQLRHQKLKTQVDPQELIPE
jgi:hypothetical protein